MSWQRPVLNRFLRWFEKPHLRRADDPGTLRRGFEAKARFWFRPPRGARFTRGDLGGVPVLWADVGPDVQRGVILYFHGGGYVFGSPDTHRAMLARLAQASGQRACLPGYRLAPENPFPAAIDDARAAYDALLATGVPAASVILGGDSAGAGLALALLAEILERKGPVPAGLFAFSPLTDVTFSGASLKDNAQAEAMLPASRAGDMAAMYLAGHDPRDPRVSPLYADFSGAPDVWMAVGDTEILLDDTRRMAERLRAQGVETTATIEHDLPHVWPIFAPLLPEAVTTLQDLAGWIRRRLPPSAES